MNPELIKRVVADFINKFEERPLLVFSPGRINIIGEHTDYNDGFVLPAAIDKGIITAISKSNTGYSSILATDLNKEFVLDIINVKHFQKGGWKNYVIGVVTEIQKSGRSIGNFNLAFGGNIPAGAGLSSSAALENSVVFAINELFELGLTKKEMVFISQRAEHNYVGVNCGIMDQFASMFGQEKSVIFLDCQNLKTRYIHLNLMNYCILLINTNVKHSLAESAYNDRRSTCERIAHKLGSKSLRGISEDDLKTIQGEISKHEFQKALYVIQENERVIQAVKSLENNELENLGNLLYESHYGLKHQFQVSCNELDFLVEYAKENSTVIGARMIGGGFGGCVLHIIEKEHISEYMDMIALAYRERFQIDCTGYMVNISGGTKIVDLHD